MTKILFVCLGNICRSPAAEGYMNHLIRKANLTAKYNCESAGTSHYHEGELPDQRMRKKASQRGYRLESLARQFDPQTDFTKYDHIIAMDRSNLRDILNEDYNRAFSHKVQLMGNFCTKFDIENVPDPYTGGEQGFDHVLDIIEDGCNEFLKKLNID